jgi:hypothetical protein
MSQAVGNANALADLPNAFSASTRFNLRDDPQYLGEIKGTPIAGTPYPDLGAWDNSTNPPTWRWNFDANHPNTSWVVYVDPIGRTALPPGTYVGGYNKFAVTGLGTQVGVPRVTTYQMAGSFVASKNFCSQDDDLTFNLDGSATYDTGFVERGRRYSWGYTCRWPRFTDKSVVDMGVPVYSARGTPVPLNNGGSTSLSTEPTFLGGGGPTIPNPPAWWNQLAFVQGSTTASILLPQQSSGASLPIRRGDWVFDNTLIIPPNTNQPIPLANGYFYKVIGISDSYQNANNIWVQDIQLDRPAKNFGFAVVLLQGVGDVKEKSDGRMPVK